MTFQYLVPVAVPVVLAILIAPFVIPSGALTSTGILNTGHVLANSSSASSTLSNTASSKVDEFDLANFAETDESITAAASKADLVSESEVAADAEEEVEMKEEAEESEDEEALIGEADAADAKKIAVQGGKWDEELHDAVAPTCHDIETRPYEGSMRTGFVSYPR